MSAAGCPFCEIVAGRAEASVAYEDDRVVAFMDLAAANAGHVLVVPRRHVASLRALDHETGAHVFVVAMRIAAAVRESGVRCEGVNLFLSDGEAAGQDVFHTHLHVVPRWKGDEFRVDAHWSWPERVELDAVAAAIRAAHERLFG